MLSTLPMMRILKHVKMVAITIFIFVMLCVFRPLVAHATTPVTSVDNLFQSIGGNVYINRNWNWEDVQYCASDGSWHNVTDLKPLDPANEDGAPVDLENGWKMRWVHDSMYGGEYAVYRAPDGGVIPAIGSSWNGFKLRLVNVGYTASGETFDSLIEINSIFVWQRSPKLHQPIYLYSFQINKPYGPMISSDTRTPYADFGTKATFTTTFVKTGTNTEIDSSNELDAIYWDIDQPIHYKEDGSLYHDFVHQGREGVGLNSGYKSALIGTDTTLRVTTDANGTTWFKSGAIDDSPVPDTLSTAIARVGTQSITDWTGEACSTNIKYDSNVTAYPDWPTPVKSPERQIKKRGETATFDVTENFPYVADSNKASSIIMKDTLDSALDASQATVQVLKKGVNETDYTDVTDNWTISISGQTITATAKNTGHGFAEGEHIFRVTVPVAGNADLSTYEREEKDGKTYWKVPNRASVFINNHEKKTNTVYVLVPHEVKGSVKLEAMKKLQGGILQAGQFTFTLKNEAGDIIDTQKNDASGGITFKELTYTQDDIGKTFTYTIEEVAGSEAGYTYDTHKEIVTIEVKKNWSGTLNIVTTYESGFPQFINKYQPQVPLTVIKKSTDGKILAGAEFTLYKDDGNGTFDANDQPATIYSDKELTKLIPGAVVTTDASGEAHYFGLVPGTTYWLKETKAPTGYNLDTTVHMISVSSDGKISTEDSSGTTAALPLKDGVASITIADEPIPALPLTAGAGVAGLLAIGSILIAGGGGIALFRRRN